MRDLAAYCANFGCSTLTLRDLEADADGSRLRVETQTACENESINIVLSRATAPCPRSRCVMTRRLHPCDAAYTVHHRSICRTQLQPCYWNHASYSIIKISRIIFHHKNINDRNRHNKPINCRTQPRDSNHASYSIIKISMTEIAMLLELR